MTHEELIEGMARAMCAGSGGAWDAANRMETGNGEEPWEQREYWKDRAMEASVYLREALKEPDSRMGMAGLSAAGRKPCLPVHFMEAYRAMLAASPLYPEK